MESQPVVTGHTPGAPDDVDIHSLLSWEKKKKKITILVMFEPQTFTLIFMKPQPQTVI